MMLQTSGRLSRHTSRDCSLHLKASLIVDTFWTFVKSLFYIHRLPLDACSEILIKGLI
jgi:hypothetical protein